MNEVHPSVIPVVVATLSCIASMVTGGCVLLLFKRLFVKQDDLTTAMTSLSASLQDLKISIVGEYMPSKRCEACRKECGERIMASLNYRSDQLKGESKEVYKELRELVEKLIAFEVRMTQVERELSESKD